MLVIEIKNLDKGRNGSGEYVLALVSLGTSLYPL